MPLLASDTEAMEWAAAATLLARLEPSLETGRLLVASDFDGTLAKLSLDPWAARIVPRAQRALRRLAAEPGCHVAFISGRTVADLAARVRVGGASYRGDHGAERAEAPRSFRVASLRTQREPSSPVVGRLVATLVRTVPLLIPEPWLVVEDKVGSVTFHFRGAPDIDAAHARVRSAVDALDPDKVLQRSGSRRAIELRPVDASNKGDALRGLLDEFRPSTLIMLGDDHNDALAFDVLRAVRSAGEVAGLAIAVAGHAEVTAAVAPRADAVIAGPQDAARFLAALAALLQGTGLRSTRGRLAHRRGTGDDDGHDVHASAGGRADSLTT